ncbi:hypothetical protein C5167_000631 [Papaver somniferum]|uniref:Centromere protein S n=1 Tax=Papaver somniferum TaxID=3469 RepID=A0A4Y7KWM7_PAPSO|nr:hypothetical protein C5167_000631 [Papaver somniferum]
MDERDDSDFEREEEEESTRNVLKDRFRLSVIKIAEAEGFFNLSQSMNLLKFERARRTIWRYLSKSWVVFLILPSNFQLAKDLELFAQHAGRKSVNMDDVILSAHRNEHLASSLRLFSSELKGKEPQPEKKRKKTSKKEDKTPSAALHIS